MQWLHSKLLGQGLIPVGSAFRLGLTALILWLPALRLRFTSVILSLCLILYSYVDLSVCNYLGAVWLLGVWFFYLLVRDPSYLVEALHLPAPFRYPSGDHPYLLPWLEVRAALA